MGRIYRILLSERAKNRFERVILIIAIVSFVAHLGLILGQDLFVLNSSRSNELLTNPIAAIYTPFSFILIYEVYLLIYFLPESITTYISKQYEIITLIIIRRLFKDLSNLELTSQWFQVKNDLQFTYDIATAVILFFLIYLFYSKGKSTTAQGDKGEIKSLQLRRFINFKKGISVCLVPLLLVLAAYSFTEWTIEQFRSGGAASAELKDVNSVFFDEFFTILIIADVLLLLFSFFLTDKFHKVIRNSGFVISTILLRLSFSVEGLLNNLLIVSAVLFGLLIMVIHNQYERRGIVSAPV